jgi:mono/diheme cytochrome c family protein
MRKNDTKGFSGKTVLAAISAIGVAGLLSGLPAAAHAGGTGAEISPGLNMPTMDPIKGKALFVSKGCVVCHSVNGVGGTDAPQIDASVMSSKMNPFDFVAKMWNHSQGMVAMQQNELGGQITFENGQQIADIIAFLHDADVQKTLIQGDLPADIKAHLQGVENGAGSGGMMKNGSMMGNGGTK